MTQRGRLDSQSSVCAKIVQLLGQNEVDCRQKQVVILSQDSFYRVLTSEQKAKALKGQFNFDHPDAFDNELIFKTLKEITEGKTVQIPVYDFVSHSRKEETVTVYPADVVLFEGILAFYSQEVRDLFQMKLRSPRGPRGWPSPAASNQLRDRPLPKRLVTSAKGFGAVVDLETWVEAVGGPSLSSLSLALHCVFPRASALLCPPHCTPIAAFPAALLLICSWSSVSGIRLVNHPDQLWSPCQPGLPPEGQTRVGSCTIFLILVFPFLIVLRDISERGRDLEQILSQYITFVKPAFEEFCLPTKKYADVIIPRGADNLVAINLIVQHIQDILNGGLSKRQTNGYLNGYIPSRKRQPSESSSRPH
ncbi:uridine-cytidine kinase 2 [Crocuta crocuta]